MLMLVRKENEQYQGNIFQDTFFKNSQIHQLTMYRFEHINHDNPPNFLFQNRYKLFLRARNLHQ